MELAVHLIGLQASQRHLTDLHSSSSMENFLCSTTELLRFYPLHSALMHLQLLRTNGTFTSSG